MYGIYKENGDDVGEYAFNDGLHQSTHGRLYSVGRIHQKVDVFQSHETLEHHLSTLSALVRQYGCNTRIVVPCTSSILALKMVNYFVEGSRPRYNTRSNHIDAL